MALETFSFIPTKVTLKRKARLLTAQFGDGYAQDVPDGLNSNLQTWELSFDKVAASKGRAIDDFLTANTGKQFYWKSPRNETLKFICKEWQLSNADEAQRVNVSVTFEQRV